MFLMLFDEGIILEKPLKYDNLMITLIKAGLSRAKHILRSVSEAS